MAGHRLCERIYHIRRKPDVAFVPKQHKIRDVKMPTEVVEVVRDRNKHAPHPRWIFVNAEGRPGNHFLRKFKRIAPRASANCGNCVAPWTAGRRGRLRLCAKHIRSVSNAICTGLRKLAPAIWNLEATGTSHVARSLKNFRSDERLNA